jgi:hypothetical protein
VRGSLARSVEVLDVLLVAVRLDPALVVGIDDAEHIPADRRRWSSLLAAMAAGRGSLHVVFPDLASWRPEVDDHATRVRGILARQSPTFPFPGGAAVRVLASAA